MSEPRGIPAVQVGDGGCSSLAFMTALGLPPEMTAEAQLVIVKVVFGDWWRRAVHVCKVHDRAYAWGGTYADRLKADVKVRDGWLQIAKQHRAPSFKPRDLWIAWWERRGIRVWARTGYAAIRMFGELHIKDVGWGYKVGFGYTLPYVVGEG